MAALVLGAAPRDAEGQRTTTIAANGVAKSADLRVVHASYEKVLGGFYRWKIKIKNVGNGIAVFDAPGAILSRGEVFFEKGDVLLPDQVVEVELMTSIWSFDGCPGTTSRFKYGIWKKSWPYALPQPVSGQLELLLVDPQGAVTESSESNNKYQLRVPNPYYGWDAAEGEVDLIIQFLDTSSSLGLTFHIKNIGTKPFYHRCGATWPAFEIYVRGTSEYSTWKAIDAVWKPLPNPGSGLNYVLVHAPLAMQTPTTSPATGETTWSGEGLPPGCYEGKVVVDPQDQVEERIECNNTTTFNFRIGDMKCPTTQTRPCSFMRK